METDEQQLEALEDHLLQLPMCLHENLIFPMQPVLTSIGCSRNQIDFSFLFSPLHISSDQIQIEPPLNRSMLEVETHQLALPVE